MKWLSIFVVVVIVLSGAWFFMKGSHQTTSTQTMTAPDGTETETKVVVTKTDITKTGLTSLPVGFPEDIPVERNNITESYRAAYKEKGIVQYAVSFTSLKTRDVLWTSYSDYMNSAGYTVDKGATSKSLGQISGAKGGNNLSVVVSAHSGLSLVQINYLER